MQGAPKVLFLRESHLADMVAIAGVAALVCMITERTGARLLLLLPLVAYGLVHGWHMLVATNILTLQHAGELSTSGLVVILPDDGGARFSEETERALATISRLRLAHLVTAGLGFLCSCSFAALHRRPSTWREALDSRE
jgi:hypothetical protein